MSKKSWYVLRIVAGLYLTYLGINLFRNVMSDAPKNKAFMLFMAGIFAVVGVFYAVSSFKKVWAMKDEEPIDEAEDEAEDELEADETGEVEYIEKKEESADNISENEEDNDTDEN